MRVVTYNIHGCIGADRRFDPARTASILCSLNADVLALQEVEHRSVNDQDLLGYFAGQTGLEAIPGPVFLRNEFHYGNALLTRASLLHVRHRDLSVLKREPRGAIDASLSWQGQKIRVIVTHLGLSAQERRWQIQQLLDLGLTAKGDRTILLGDFNEWWPWSRVLRGLRREFGHFPASASFPAYYPCLSLDRIWLYGHQRATAWGVEASPLTRIASDHLPLKAVVEW